MMSISEDLVQNLWVNRSEIPDDGEDNDNNGLIDDYQGWNFTDASPEVAFGDIVHGFLNEPRDGVARQHCLNLL